MSLVPWIKIDHTLPDKPEVIRMTSALKIDQDAVTGKLIRLWIWADQNTVNGDNMPITEAFIDRLTGCKRFAQAMRAAGWLEGDDGKVTFPGFQRHNGETAKARAETNRRVANHRQRNKSGVTNVTRNPFQKPLPEEEGEEDKREQSSLARRAAHFVSRINSLRPGVWTSPQLNRAEESAAVGNIAVLEAIPEDSWPIMAAYLAYRHPEGSGAWLVQIRLKFLEAPNDLEARALDWNRKHQRRNPPPQTILPAPPREPLARSEISSLLSIEPPRVHSTAA